MRASHRFLEHTSEARLRVRAGSLAELLAEAGRALAELQLRGADARPTGPWRELRVRAADRSALLVDWLNELVLVAERDRWVALEFDVREASETAALVRGRGAVLGEAPALVKAATMNDVRVTEVTGGIEAELTLDV